MNRWLIGALLLMIAICILSLFLNLFLIREARHLYRSEQYRRLFPIYIPDDRGIDENFSDDLPSVAFVGDSRAVSWYEASNNQNYYFLNWGINGESSAQLLYRMPHHFAQYQPDVVVIQVGINDLRGLSAMSPERQQLVVQNTKDHIAEVVRIGQASGSIVIVTTIFPPGTPPLFYRQFWSSRVDEAIGEVNAYLATLVDDDVFILDAYGKLIGEDRRIEEQYAIDYLHLNANGYHHLDEFLYLIIESQKN